MAKFIVNSPKDLVVLRIDGTIAHEVRGRGRPQRTEIQPKIYASSPAKDSTSSQVAYRRFNPPMDIMYFSSDELTTKNLPTITQKVRKRLQEVRDRKSAFVEGFRDYIDHFAQAAQQAALYQVLSERQALPQADLNVMWQRNCYDRVEEIDLTPYKKLEGRLRELVGEEVEHELRRYFPNVSPDRLLTPREGYPPVELNTSALSHYLEFTMPDASSAEKYARELCAAAGEGKMSAASRVLVDKIKDFPGQIRDRKLKKLFAPVMEDPQLLVRVSPGADISDWDPTFQRNMTGGSYNALENILTLPSAALHNQSYPIETFLGRPHFACIKNGPKHVPPPQLGALPPLNEIRFEELFHCRMEQVFHNGTRPYGMFDKAARIQHTEAAIKDLTYKNGKMRMDVVRRLDLEAYIETDISFRRHMNETEAATAHHNMGAELVAKVARLVEREGWAAAREIVPNLTADLETRILPQCLAQAEGQGEAKPRAAAIAPAAISRSDSWRK